MAKGMIAVYPGTFDPMTLGHEDVIRRAIEFDRVIVAVAAGHHKKAMFTLQERIEMARVVTEPFEQVDVESFSGLLRDFVVAREAGHGSRAARGDRLRLRVPAGRHEPQPDARCGNGVPHAQRQVQFISSTFVREIAVLGGEVDKFVSPSVQEKLMEKVRSLGRNSA